MAWIHHPVLEVDVEVPDETVEIWCGDPGWRPGTLTNPEPWSPPPALDADGNPITAPEISEPAAEAAPSSKKRGTPATVPVGDSTITPDTED